MAYDGYIAFAGQEIANRARLNAYVNAYMPHVLRPCECACDDLPAALGHHGYSTPFGDEAPWTDEDDPDSGEFYGVMVNSMRGIDDSVKRVTYSDALRGGGAQVDGRDEAREVRFVMTAFAGSEAGMEAGWRWLKSALQGPCEGDMRLGADLCFFSTCPPVGRPVGPQVITKIHGNTLVPQNARWDGRVFTPGPGAAPMTEDPEGYYDASGLTEDPEGYLLGWKEAEPGYLWSDSARLSTPWLARPIACGEAFWEFDVAGEGEVTFEAVVDGRTVSSQTVQLTEEAQTFRVSEGGNSDEGSRTFARMYGRWGVVAVVESVREIRHEHPEPDADCSDDYLRTLYDVFVTDGPVLRMEREVQGGIIREFEFVATAMSPAIFGAQKEIATLYHGQGRSMLGADIREWSGPFGSCVDDPVDPLVDPDCPPLAPLPSVPSIPIGCSQVDPDEWQAAYLVTIPSDLLQSWVDVVPVLSFRSDGIVRGVRARFFPRPVEEWGLSDLDPCSACGTFEINFIPENSTMTIDGTTRRAVVETPGGKVHAANHLVTSGSNDVAFSWPELSCGIGYFLLVETTEGGVDGLSLRLATKE